MNLTRDDILPEMRRVHQRFTALPEIDPEAEIDSQWPRINTKKRIAAGSRIAVGVGSRGIHNLHKVVRAVVNRLQQAGAHPFVTPAMGSHGGATAQGQIRVLARLGITEARVGAPVRATMAVQPLGTVAGIPLFLDRLAHEADGIVLINRIKRHTDFSGPTESGIIKMMAIGLGNQVGAEHYHRLAAARDMYSILSQAGNALIRNSNFLWAVGLVENQLHQTVALKMMTAEEIGPVEAEMLVMANRYFPLLPLKEIDLLIVDEIGKEISGAGMDPNVTGRAVAAVCRQPGSPSVSRIFVRDLTAASAGNAIGIGEADFTTRRLVDKIDYQATFLNCITSCCPESGRIPIHFDTDREVLKAVWKTLPPFDHESLKLVHIKNTLSLEQILVSVGCLPGMDNRGDVFAEPQAIRLQFDSAGNLISVFD